MQKLRIEPEYICKVHYVFYFIYQIPYVVVVVSFI